MVKHTPGPWRVYHENGSMGSGGSWGVESGSHLNPRTVAVVSAVGPIGQADAALIAAAPDLLAALEEACLAYAVHDGAGHHEPSCATNARCYLCTSFRVNAALAKVSK